jgi:hypothetical protein
MSDTVSFVNKFTNDEQEDALHGIFDSMHFQNAKRTELMFAAQLDSEVRNYLLHLSLCEWDKCLAVLTWAE